MEQTIFHTNHRGLLVAYLLAGIAVVIALFLTAAVLYLDFQSGTMPFQEVITSSLPEKSEASPAKILKISGSSTDTSFLTSPYL